MDKSSDKRPKETILHKAITIFSRLATTTILALVEITAVILLMRALSIGDATAVSLALIMILVTATYMIIYVRSM